MIAAAIYPISAQEREAKQAATQFKKGNKVNPLTKLFKDVQYCCRTSKQLNTGENDG